MIIYFDFSQIPDFILQMLGSLPADGLFTVKILRIYGHSTLNR